MKKMKITANTNQIGFNCFLQFLIFVHFLDLVFRNIIKILLIRNITDTNKESASSSTEKNISPYKLCVIKKITTTEIGKKMVANLSQAEKTCFSKNKSIEEITITGTSKKKIIATTLIVGAGNM